MNMTLLVFYFPIQDLAGRGGGGGVYFFSFDLEAWDIKTSVWCWGRSLGDMKK